MKKKYIISIDGNYDSDFDAIFYLNRLIPHYTAKGFTTKVFMINSSLSKSEILDTLGNIREYINEDGSCVALILGSLAEPIIANLLETKKIQQTFDDYEEISRVYHLLSQRNPSINILLIKNSENKELAEGFRKIDSMNISMGFEFDLIDIDNRTMMENYRQILDIMEKRGWDTPLFPSGL